MAIKLKRGTTESWALGPELVDFGQSSTKGKDSIIRAEGTELEMYVYTTSANEWWTGSPTGGGQSTGKIPGLPIYVNGKRQPEDASGDGMVGCTLKIYFEAPSDCTLEYIDGTGTLYRPQFVNYEYATTGYEQGGGSFPQLFVKWPAEKIGTAEPVPIKIRVSLRENWLCEELEEGQLGLEYTEDGDVKLKAGMPGISKWNELPYVGAQADWNIVEESNPTAIKNKPFGMVEQMVDIVPEAEYDFTQPYEMTTDIGCFNAPNFNDNLSYNVWFNDTYLGIAKPKKYIEIPNGQFYFDSGVMIIKGGNYPEGKYKIRIVEKQVINKKLDSQWLNIQDNIYDGDMTDPVNGRAVATAISDIGATVSQLNGQIVHEVIPAIGPIPSEVDNGKLLQVVDGKPIWANTKVLIVTAEQDEESEYYKASHTPKQIYDHIQSGGIAVLKTGEGDFYNPYYTSEEGSFFFHVDDGLGLYLCEINDSRECSFSDQQLASWQSINDLMQVITVDENYIPSMTSQEIYNRVLSGGRVVLNYDGKMYSLASCNEGSAYFNYYDDGYVMYCVEIFYNEFYEHERRISASADWMLDQLGSINKTLDDLKDRVLPSVTTADNGKLLQVVDGAWVTVSITNGNEVAY